MIFVIVLLLNLIRRLQIFFVASLQFRVQFGVAEPGEDAACAVETHIFETMVSVALFTPSTYTVRTPYIRIKATAG